MQVLGHTQRDRDRGTGAEVDTREQGKDISTGMEAGTGRGFCEQRQGRVSGTDSMTGSKHKLIHEKRKRKRMKERQKEGRGGKPAIVIFAT